MITKIKWKNHPILKNLELDFTKVDGTPYNTIVLVGENGSGKTTILETLRTFLNKGSFAPFENIQYIVDGTTYTLSQINVNESTSGFHIRKNEATGQSIKIRSNNNNNRDSIKTDIEDIRHYGFAYSKARSDFKTDIIKSTSSESLNKGKYCDDENDDYTSIKQLLVNLESEDNALLRKLFSGKGSKNKIKKEFENKSKLRRFSDAFNSFFKQTIEYNTITTENNEKKIFFKKGDDNVLIDNLSTGEKQIVFRGTYLLRNKDILLGGIILIDEPELSMHPKWQERVLEYYRNLFTSNNIQETQIIFATHSENILKSALENINNKKKQGQPEDILIIALKNKRGIISSKKIDESFVLPSLTFAEINFHIFDVISTDLHIALYAYIQSEKNLSEIKKCDEYIKNQTIYYNPNKHEKIDTYKGITYETLPTYIRNAIDHPDSNRVYSQVEFRLSISLLIKICCNINKSKKKKNGLKTP